MFLVGTGSSAPLDFFVAGLVHFHLSEGGVFGVLWLYGAFLVVWCRVSMIGASRRFFSVPVLSGYTVSSGYFNALFWRYRAFSLLFLKSVFVFDKRSSDPVTRPLSNRDTTTSYACVTQG